MLRKTCQGRDRFLVPDSHFALGKLRLPGRLDLFCNPLVSLLRTLADQFAFP